MFNLLSKIREGIERRQAEERRSKGFYEAYERFTEESKERVRKLAPELINDYEPPKKEERSYTLSLESIIQMDVLSDAFKERINSVARKITIEDRRNMINVNDVIAAYKRIMEVYVKTKTSY